MFKRVERKRKRREEEEELGLDEDTKQALYLNDTDSDESGSSSEEGSVQSDLDEDVGEGGDQDVTSENEDINDKHPISVEEVLKDPIYLVSLDPTVHQCVLCKGKLIKNTGMATAHKSASVHKRRFERFRLLSTSVDPRSNAWELAREIQSTSNLQALDSQEPSNRALKRQAKQVAIREKKKLHRKLKAKAIAKKALKKSTASNEKSLDLVVPSEGQPIKNRKKQKSESKTPMRSSDMVAKSASRTKTSSVSKKSVVKSVTKGTRNKASRPSQC